MFAAANSNQRASAPEEAPKVGGPLGRKLASQQLRLRLAALLAISMFMTIIMTVFVIQAECAGVLKLRRVSAPAGNELDGDEGVAPSYQQQQQQSPRAISRVRREAGSSGASKLQQLEQLNEQTMRSQLPDWIAQAQAHKDKSIERALLRMLINASLRSSLGGSGAGASTRPVPAGWQVEAGAGNEGSLLDGGAETAIPVAAHSPARLEEATGQEFGQTGSALDGFDLGTLIATISQLNTAQLQPLDQGAYPMMDKREYIKPCSFNAISCVRTPFRKL